MDEELKKRFMLIYRKMISDTVEHLERAKNELDNIRVHSEINNSYEFVDDINEYIEKVQEVIDELSE